MLDIIIGICMSYLVGSIPSAYIFGKVYKGIDIRQHGSGNVGATNVFRVLGKGPGISVLVIDILKGVVAIIIIGDIFGLSSIIERIFLGVAAVSGHNWTLFLQFKGGKGIATSLGVLIGLTIKFYVLRPVLLFSVLIWLVIFLLTGYVSLASIIASISLPVIMVLTFQAFEIVVLGIVFCIFVVLRHRPNIRRLLDKKESRVNFPFLHKK
jgi:glycerol-3-phosphate acyltransferase PlsY